MTSTAHGSTSLSASGAPATSGYNFFLLVVAGLGGLLYGIDVGIIGSALPYLQATSHLTAGQSSIIVAAVLLAASFRRFLREFSPTGWAASR
jgi:hypothetical protein